MDKEVVVQDPSRRRQQVGLFMLLLLRSTAPLLSQKIGIRNHHRLRFLRAHFLPLVVPDIPTRCELHLGSLHVLGGTILGLELGLDDASIAGLINRKRLRPYTIAVLEYAERTRV